MKQIRRRMAVLVFWGSISLRLAGQCIPSSDPESIQVSSTTICKGEEISLTLIGGGKGTYESIVWYTASCGGSLVGKGQGLSVKPDVTTTYLGRYEDEAPCKYISKCVYLTITVINPSKEPGTAKAEPEVICEGQSSVLTLTEAVAGKDVSVMWYVEACGKLPVGEGNNLNVSPIATTTYYGRLEYGNPCETQSTCREVTVKVIPQGKDPVTARCQPDAICEGQTVILSLEGGDPGIHGKVHWYTSSCGGTPIGIGNNYVTKPSSTTTYFGRYEVPEPCLTNTTCAYVTVEVNPGRNDRANAIAVPDTVLKDQGTSLILKGVDGNAHVEWYEDRCGGSPVGHGNNLTVYPSKTTIYYGREVYDPPCPKLESCSEVKVVVVGP